MLFAGKLEFSDIRAGGCLRGELLGLLFSLHRNGLEWIPRGGVDETISGTEGGNSGSGISDSGSGSDSGIEAEGRPGASGGGDRRRTRPRNGLASSSSSEAGGGNGRGFGLFGVRLAAAPMLPPARRIDRPAPGVGSASSVLPTSLSNTLSARRIAKSSDGLCSTGSSLGACGKARRALGLFWGDVERRLSRISGLWCARLALVGEAKDGRFRRAVVSASGDVGVVDAPAMSREVRGDVRRRFGADSSIAGFCVVMFRRCLSCLPLCPLTFTLS